jgi:hypothetical protein
LCNLDSEDSFFVDFFLEDKHWHSHTSMVFHFILHLKQNQSGMFVPPVYIN